MDQKCEHKTSTVMEYHGNVSLSECDWGCGAILVSVTDGNGISHEFTAEELLALRERVTALGGLETAVTEYRDLWLNRSEANYAERMGAHDEILRVVATAEGGGDGIGTI